MSSYFTLDHEVYPKIKTEYQGRLLFSSSLFIFPFNILERRSNPSMDDRRPFNWFAVAKAAQIKPGFLKRQPKRATWMTPQERTHNNI